MLLSFFLIYRLDRQCCPSVHCPCGQCRFSPIFLQLLAWAKLDFRVDSGQCRITAAILPEALSTWTMLPVQIFFWGLSQVDASARGIVQHCKIGFQSRLWTMPHYCSNTPRGLRYCSKWHHQIPFANWQKWHHKCNENLFSLVFLTTMISFCTTSVQNFWAKSIIFDLVLCDFLYLFILSNFCWKKILKSKLKWKWHHKCAKYFLREPSISVPG